LFQLVHGKRFECFRWNVVEPGSVKLEWVLVLALAFFLELAF